MGLASIFLGDSNPFSQWAAQNSGLLGSVGGGIAQGTNLGQGLSYAAQNVAQGKQSDIDRAEKEAAKAKAEQAINLTSAWLKQNYPAYANLPPEEGFKLALEAEQNKMKSTDTKPVEVNGQLVDPTTGKVIGDYRDPAKPPAAPSGYQWGPDNKLGFIPGGPNDPAAAAPKPPTDADVRSSKLASVIQGDKALLLGDPATGKPGVYDALSDFWSQAANTDFGVAGVGVGRPGAALASPEFQNASNALSNIAQSYLYAISGQAAPAGEVAKIVDSVTPKMGESAISVKAKKARLKSYIDAIEASRYDAATPSAGGGAADPLGIR